MKKEKKCGDFKLCIESKGEGAEIDIVGTNKEILFAISLLAHSLVKECKGIDKEDVIESVKIGLEKYDKFEQETNKEDSTTSDDIKEKAILDSLQKTLEDLKKIIEDED